MSMSEIDPRAFGRLESEVENLQELVRAQTVAMNLMNERLNTMNTTLSEARGGWRTVMLIGGSAASLGGLLSWALTNITTKGHP